MSRIRFQGTAPASIPVPPSGKASLFYDNSDHSLKMKLDNGDVLALGVTETYIQEIATSAIGTSNSIFPVYDAQAKLIYLNIQQSSINDFFVDKISPTKIVDSQNGRFQANLTTTDNVPTSIYSLDCSPSGIWMVELRVTARRIGGLSGNPGDGAVFKRTFRIKSNNSLATVCDLQSDYTSRDNKQMSVLVAPDSAAVVVRVAGLTDNTFKWNIDLITSVNT